MIRRQDRDQLASAAIPGISGPILRIHWVLWRQLARAGVGVEGEGGDPVFIHRGSRGLDAPGCGGSEIVSAKQRGNFPRTFGVNAWTDLFVALLSTAPLHLSRNAVHSGIGSDARSDL